MLINIDLLINSRNGNCIDCFIRHIFSKTAVATARNVPKMAPLAPKLWINDIFSDPFIIKPAVKLTTANRCWFIPCKTEELTVKKAKNNETGAYQANKELVV